MLPLKEIVLVNLTSKLVSDYYTRLMMKCFKDDLWNEIMRLEISTYNIPLTLQEEIIVLMKPLALEIHNWMVDHNGIFTEKQERILEFCFNPDGTVNRVKTADFLIHSKRLDVQRRFVLACQYWSSWDVLGFFKNLPQHEREQILHKNSTANENLKKYKENVLHWINLYRNGCIVKSQPRDWCYKLYNWTDVSLQSRLLDDLLKKERQSILDDAFENTSKMHVVRFCLSRMSVNDCELLLTLFPLKVLRIYLFRPYHHFFMEAANKVWHRLPGNHFTSLLHIIICQKIVALWKDYDYVNLLREFWHRSPEHLKQYAEQSDIFEILIDIVKDGFPPKDVPKYFFLHDACSKGNEITCDKIIIDNIIDQ
ncbi:uncharacterized protein TNCV_1394461 [Trichonephila clavipes]|nr:uncharacterized protein TNCV_1394461 [Trichonephila clavipes]